MPPVTAKAAPTGLDWQEFSSAYFPSRRRHDLEALTAYAAYRRNLAAEPAPAETDRALEAWEDEGGPAGDERKPARAGLRFS
jgi:hypothetical protein